MRLNGSDLSELVELWAELNLSSAHSNLSQMKTLLCSGALSHATLLRLLSVLYVAVFLVGVASNLLVLWVNVRPGSRRHDAHLYVMHLAAADLCVVLTLPVWVSSLVQGGLWPFGEPVCRLAQLLFSVNLFSSVFFLTCMSVDSYLSVALSSAPRRKQALRRLVCAAVWLVALLASLPEACFLQTVKSPHHDGILCRPVYPPENPRAWMVGVQLSFSLLGFAVPFPTITVFYVLLARRFPPSPDQDRRLGERVVLSYILVFLVCWLPFHGVLLLDTLTLLDVVPFSCRLEAFLDVALHLTQCFSLLHCCINPVLYTFLRRSARRDLMKAFVFRYAPGTGLAGLTAAPGAENSTVTTNSAM